MAEHDPRVEALEIKVAHLERTTQQLSDELFRQQREIEALQMLNRQLLQQLQGLEDGAADPNRVEIPPHY